jgi:hypothetical protein
VKNSHIHTSELIHIKVTKDYSTYSRDALLQVIASDVSIITKVNAEDASRIYDVVSDNLKNFSDAQLVKFKETTHIIKSWKAKLSLAGTSVNMMYNRTENKFYISEYRSIKEDTLTLAIPETPVRCIGLTSGMFTQLCYDITNKYRFNDVVIDLIHMSYGWLQPYMVLSNFLVCCTSLYYKGISSNIKSIALNIQELTNSIKLTDELCTYNNRGSLVIILNGYAYVKALDYIMNMLVNEKDNERLIALNKSTGHIQKFVEYNEIITMMEKIVNSDIQDLTNRKKLATELFNLLKKDNTIEACALMQKDVHLVLNQEMDRDMNKIRLKYKPVF